MEMGSPFISSGDHNIPGSADGLALEGCNTDIDESVGRHDTEGNPNDGSKHLGLNSTKNSVVQRQDAQFDHTENGVVEDRGDVDCLDQVSVPSDTGKPKETLHF